MFISYCNFYKYKTLNMIFRTAILHLIVGIVMTRFLGYPDHESLSAYHISRRLKQDARAVSETKCMNTKDCEDAFTKNGLLQYDGLVCRVNQGYCDLIMI